MESSGGSGDIRCPQLLSAVVRASRGWNHKEQTKHILNNGLTTNSWGRTASSAVTSSSSTSISDDIYGTFLRRAQAVAGECEAAQMQVQGSFKLKAGTLRPHQPGKESNTLGIIFKFYCHIDLKQEMSFEELEAKEKAMTYYEFELFARDFNICPKFLTREELTIIFKNMSFEKIQRGDRPMTHMSIEDFKDSIVRMALAMYNKPGLKRLISAASGIEPSAVEKVSYFCHYIRLDDLVAVRALLRTKGKKVQGEVNYPAAQNKESHRIKDMLQEELESRKIIHEIKEQFGVKHSTRRFHPMGSTFKGTSKPTSSISENRSTATQKQSLLPSKIMEMINSGATPMDDDLSVLENDEEGEEAEQAPRPQSRGADDVSIGRSVSSAVTKDTAMLKEEYSQQMFTGYGPDLFPIVDRYCMDAHVVASSDIIETGMPCADIGHVAAGVDCTIYLKLTNKSKDDIHFDATCQGLQSSNAHITTKPDKIVPGFSRVIAVEFTIEPQVPTVMGFVNIHIAVPRTKRSYCLQCPVYFKLSPTFSLEGALGHPRLTMRTCSDLFRTRGLDFKLLSLDFSKKGTGTISSAR